MGLLKTALARRWLSHQLFFLSYYILKACSVHGQGDTRLEMGCSRNKATVMCFKEVWSWFLCEFYFKWSIVNLCGWSLHLLPTLFDLRFVHLIDLCVCLLISGRSWNCSLPVHGWGLLMLLAFVCLCTCCLTVLHGTCCLHGSGLVSPTPKT